MNQNPLKGEIPVSHNIWTKFTYDMLTSLSPGNYSLRRKSTVTGAVSGTEHCSVEDQLLFAEVDNMEHNILNSVIESKIKELHKKRPRSRVSVTCTYDKVTEAREYTLVIINRVDSDKKTKDIVKNLGELLAMAYDEILIPDLPKFDSSAAPANVFVTLQDHNYLEPYIAQDIVSKYINPKKQN